MPTPADHVREVERLIAKAACLADSLDPTGWLSATLARAQTHLALAASAAPTAASVTPERSTAPGPSRECLLHATRTTDTDLDHELACLLEDMRPAGQQDDGELGALPG
ncbi:hypothetical protein GCM10010193_70920 [Kitasatospora atroaurantiaca]|uniref:Uncharacterized protein n=1 Tax=Kitasatospora atroaurantiaca TaxID=285545 RepID=A0A561ENI5_9ACTN|nr:hypothetical protein [Kitasatospora atroaurantiaca]TWE17176.1 hypothetical protein FB465_2183 [Kitasatospora atroaurantiaca]